MGQPTYITIQAEASGKLAQVTCIFSDAGINIGTKPEPRTAMREQAIKLIATEAYQAAILAK